MNWGASPTLGIRSPPFAVTMVANGILAGRPVFGRSVTPPILRPHVRPDRAVEAADSREGDIRRRSLDEGPQGRNARGWRESKDVEIQGPKADDLGPCVRRRRVEVGCRRPQQEGSSAITAPGIAPQHRASRIQQSVPGVDRGSVGGKLRRSGAADQSRLDRRRGDEWRRCVSSQEVRPVERGGGLGESVEVRVEPGGTEGPRRLTGRGIGRVARRRAAGGVLRRRGRRAEAFDIAAIDDPQVRLVGAAVRPGRRGRCSTRG